jgi:hypothetical protein
MVKWTWPFVVVFLGVLFAAAGIAIWSPDQTIRAQAAGYFGDLVPFVLGAGAGAAVGGTAFFNVGKQKGKNA